MIGMLLLLCPPILSAEPSYPPALPGEKQVVTDRDSAFLKAPVKLRPGVAIAETPPTIDFLYYPGQDYKGNPWSVWGDGLAVSGMYYSSIGDHRAPEGNAFVFQYDSRGKSLRTIVDLRKLLNLPEGYYTPGKIHGRIDMGRDGWLYFSTHRGSTRVTTDRYHYKGDWIIRHHPGTGKSEIVVHAPVPGQCIPNSVLDPERLIFYGGMAAGDSGDKRILFFAYDIPAKRLLYSGYNGPGRYMIFAKSTGKIYFTPGLGGQLHVFDPARGGPPVPLESKIGLRSATQETPQGLAYSVSTSPEATLWSLNTKTEEIRELGPAAVGSQTYITTMDAGPAGRYLYYIPGAHGGSQKDGAPVVQFDVKTGKKKVLAFLHPFYWKKYGYTPMGTFGSAVDPNGDKLYITWNGNRGGPDRRGRLGFDTCALTVIHIPESERMP